MRALLLLAVLVANTVLVHAGGRIEGVVSDEKKSEPLIGATVVLKGSTAGAATDLDGRFSLAVEPGVYTLSVSYLGYDTKEIAEITVQEGSVTNLNVAVTEKSRKTELGEVVVRTSFKKESIASLIALQKNTNTVSQVVSAEAIRRSPDRNTGDVLKRVSAASVHDGKYLVVRGLADRYNAAMLNGVLLSSTEPDRKTFSFDLFPAGMIENIIINKAATPDLPGEFAGGLVQVNTRDIPTEGFLNVMIGTGSNSQTLGRDFYYYEGGKLDFLGIDDGTRALPAAFPDRAGLIAINATDRYDLSKQFKNDWGYKSKSAPLNAAFQLTGGNSSRLMGKRVGTMFALNHSKQNRKIDYTRTFYNQSGAVQKTLDFNDATYNEEVLWGALANFSMELSAANRISFKNLFNVSSIDNTLLRTGRNYDFGGDVRSYQLGFKSNQYYSGQLLGTHLLEGPALKLDWNLGYTRLNQDQPNLRRLEYRRNDGENVYIANIQSALPTLASASKFYSDLSDNIYQGALDVSRNVNLFGAAQLIKAGYMAQTKSRDFTSRPLGFVGTSQQYATAAPDQIFAPEHMGPDGFRISELALKDYDYGANSNLHAGYVMMDNNIGTHWRLVWGARLENFNQRLDGFQNNSPVGVNTTVTDVLPSLNATYKLNKQTNLRFSASQTVVRPEFRELSPFAFYDFELLAGIQGNPSLKRTRITNLDLRYELYPRAGELITAGVFYKGFENSIEQFYNESGVNTFTYNYGNAPKATSYGAEVEFRKKLDFTGIAALKQITAFANGSYIYNQVHFKQLDANGNKRDNDRPMQGQSPYIINGGLQYDAPNSNTNATVLFNMIGRRIFLVGNEESPSIWEAPRPILDFQISQKIMKQRGEFKLTIADIFNRPFNFYQDKNKSGRYEANNADFLRISRRSGTNVGISFNYTFKARPAAGPATANE